MKQRFKTIAWIIGFLVLLGTVAWAGDGQIDIAEIPYTISSSGSYIVVDDLSLSTLDTNGITIAADNVTLDLNGHALIGPGKAAGTTGNGIYVPSPAKYNIAIRNGTVRDWREDGINGNYARNSHFEALRCYNNGSRGIVAGHGSTVSGNTCYENGLDGIYAMYGCTISGNTCFNNGGDGIDAGEGCSISDNACRANNEDGINVEESCVVSGNACQFNDSDGIVALIGSTVSGNACSFNDNDGIAVTNGCTVSGNTCGSNQGDGIQVSYDCRVANNTCDSNGFGTADGAGILATGADNRIDSNNVTDNDRGIDLDAGGNLIIRNSASGNGTDYSIVAGNHYGQIIVTPGSGFSSTQPWANFQF